MNERKINVELLEKVRDKILAEPESYNQNKFWHVSAAAPCGTTACIAGWAVALSCGDLKALHSLTPVEVHAAARDLIGVTDGEAFSLFGGAGLSWPEPFCTLFDKAANAHARAEVAASYLNHIIKTGKVA